MYFTKMHTHSATAAATIVVGWGWWRTWAGSRCWHWQCHKDVVARLPQLLETRSTVRLQASVHEIGTHLHLMCPEQGARVVLAPAVEALHAIEGFCQATGYISF